MYMIYWCNTNFDNTLVPCCKQFDSDKMAEALKFMEELRKTSKEDGVFFITMSSENPNHVGKMGAADPSPDYNWEKRRGGSNRVGDVDVNKYKDH